MAADNVQCPHCGGAFEVKRRTKTAGDIRCPHCAGTFSSADTAKAAMRPAPRQSAAAPAADAPGGGSAGRWLVGCLLVFGLFGLLGISCVGLIFMWNMAKDEPRPGDKKTDDIAKLDKKGDDDKKKVVNLDIPFKPKLDPNKDKKPDPDKDKKPVPVLDKTKKPDPDKDKIKNPGTIPDAIVRALMSKEPAVKDSALLYMLENHPDRIYLVDLFYMIGKESEILRSGGLRILDKRLATFTRKEISTLREGLKYPLPAVQILFVDAVGALKADGVDAAPELAALLASPDREMVSHVAKALDDIGKLVPVVSETKVPAVLASGIDALRKKRLKSDQVLKIYETNLTHEEDAVKSAASLALLELAPERLPFAGVADAVASTNETLRIAGEKHLRNLLANVTAKNLGAFKGGLKHPSTKVKLIFMEAVPALKDDAREVVPELTDLVDDAEIKVAIRACEVLGGLGKNAEKAVPTLTKALDSSEKTIVVAATLALGKIDPENTTVRGKGIDVLLDDLRPDVKELRNFIANPLASKSAAQILEIGEPAVAPLVKNLMQSVRKKNGADTEQTARRLMAYKFLVEFVKRAHLKDAKLVAALRKYNLHTSGWAEYEYGLKQANAKNQSISAEVRELYARTYDAAFLAKNQISSVREPPPGGK